MNDDTTTTGKSAKPAKTAKASADQPTDDTAQPLSDTEPADASQDAVVSEVDRLRNEIKRTNRQHRKLVKRDRREEDLKPYQVELLKLQSHLEHTDKRMIVLFEGRDAAGKGERDETYGGGCCRGEISSLRPGVGGDEFG